MKKGMSVALAAVFLLFALACLALAPKKATLQDPFELQSIRVTDSNGYTSPYLAFDKADSMNETELAFVVLTGVLRGEDADESIGNIHDSSPGRDIAITSDSLNLSISGSTLISQTYSSQGGVSATYSSTPELTSQYDEGFNKFTLHLNLLDSRFNSPYPAKGQSIRYSVGFLAQSKPVTEGQIKASMTISSIAFGTDGSLKMYNGNALNFIIISKDVTGDAGFVESYEIQDDSKVELLTLNFLPTGTHSFTGVSYCGQPALWNSAGKLIGKNAAGAEVDLTAKAKDAFAQLGLSFAYSNYIPKTYFEKKSSGNPTVVTDAYECVTAVVTDPDSENIAETDDFSAVVVFAAAASVALAGFALAAVLRKTCG